MFDYRLFELMVDPSRKKRQTILSTDVTTFYIYSKEEGILSGNHVLKAFFDFYDLDIEFRFHKEDGTSFRRGDILCSIIGRANDVYYVLNDVVLLLARLSGISTITNYYKSKLGQTTLLDLKQYSPLYEAFEANALAYGGARELENLHLIDELEIEAYGNIEEAIAKAIYLYKDKRIGIEVTDIKLFYDVIKTDVEVIVLKYFNDEALRRARLDAPEDKILIIGGTITPNRLEMISKMGYPYLATPFVLNASRVLEFGVKLGK
ncbi:Nicotinate-nucleotide pyrophosphorylase (Carboxylating) [Paracholeplasma brassicae]|uniref:Nicotinate-nucleotide pyrophosphorylase (Carboxylating) n=1 Tax=Acholeplasma brassicae TaxID=61635 RepID=U4KRK6_9MOLU|nr:Nicotinate-nucleotide pyrophosphorylase (Carboxylating) [Paracholeplasma brassicae]CCV65828.1 Nicotinate-nucleotide pyrophosphorylase (Carboxylating) [Paracholeplasma brassicae]